MDRTNISKTFWTTKKSYPDYGVSKKRRFYELKYLVPQLTGESLLDLGCGDGSLLRCLLETTDIGTFYGYDISEQLLSHVDKRVITNVYDCTNPTELPKTDITILAGVIQCIPHDEDVMALFKMITSKTLFIRTACSKDDNEVCKFSNQLQDNYYSYYRSINHVIKLVTAEFDIQDMRRIYPDNLESKYGSHQYYFKVTR